MAVLTSVGKYEQRLSRVKSRIAMELCLVNHWVECAVPERNSMRAKLDVASIYGNKIKVSTRTPYPYALDTAHFGRKSRGTQTWWCGRLLRCERGGAESAI
jgi:hypothetical protein